MRPGTRWVYRETDRSGHTPRVLEYKLYARGIGPVLELGISGERDQAELVRFRRGRG
jgi:hypothetical protein